jgi:hypothetical protein
VVDWLQTNMRCQNRLVGATPVLFILCRLLDTVLSL